MSNFFKRNGATLLSFIAAGGVVLTSVLAAKNTPKAIQSVRNTEAEKGEKLTKLEVIRVAAPAYIPALISGSATITCIFGANVLNKRTQASLTSAYMMLDNAYKNYRRKMVEMHGEDVDAEVDAAIVKDKLAHDGVAPRDGHQLFYDMTSMRYFETTPENLQQAEYDLNKHLITTGYATINDFYRMLGISELDYGNRLGWSTYAHGRYYEGVNEIGFHHQRVTLDDGLECCLVYFVDEPTPDYIEY